MNPASGLERLLIRETNVSDLIQFFALEDPEPLAALFDVDFDEVRRESPIGSKSADLVLYRLGRPVAAIEVKVAHTFDDSQRKGYEDWAAKHGSPVLVLSSLDSAPADLPEGWKHCSLTTVFGAWESSNQQVVQLLATRVAGVFRRWSVVTEGVRKPLTEAGALTFADADNVALLRVISRELTATQSAEGIYAWSGVSSGGGNPIAQSFTEVEGVENVRFIADARFENQSVHLRFGVDGKLGTEWDVWRIAQALDKAITVDAFVKFIAASGAGTESLPGFSIGGRGRPRATGNWNESIAAGKALGANPGFLRDKFTRLECGGRISMTDLNSWALKLLMEAVHQHLKSAWANTTFD